MRRSSDRSAKAKINSLDRGLRILEILGEDDTAIGVTELGKRLGVDKSTACRLVSTLAGRGFVAQNPETAKYCLGLKLVELGGVVLDRIEIQREAAPFVMQLVKETGETAHLAILVDGEAVYVAQEVSPAAIIVNASIGRRAPLHCTATGKVLAAYLPDETLAVIFGSKGLPRFTPRTITSFEALKIHLSCVREQGYAVDDEELTPGVRCIAVPLRNHQGEVVATVGISGPSMRIPLEQIPNVAAVVMRIGSAISEKLGWSQLLGI